MKLSYFFFAEHFGHFLLRHFGHLKHFGHLSHSCVKTHRNSVFSLYFQTFWLKWQFFSVISKSFQSMTDKWPKKNSSCWKWWYVYRSRICMFLVQVESWWIFKRKWHTCKWCISVAKPSCKRAHSWVWAIHAEAAVKCKQWGTVLISYYPLLVWPINAASRSCIQEKIFLVMKMKYLHQRVL